MKRIFFRRKTDSREGKGEISMYGVDFLSAASALTTPEDKKRHYNSTGSSNDLENANGQIQGQGQGQGPKSSLTLPNGDFLRPVNSIDSPDRSLLPFLPEEQSESEESTNLMYQHPDGSKKISNSSVSDDLEYFESRGDFGVPFTSIHSDKKESKFQSIVSDYDDGVVYGDDNNDDNVGDDDSGDDDLSYDEEGAEFDGFDERALETLQGKDSPFHDDSAKVDVKYNDRNHFRILTQLHGSVWKHVFPYCVLNVIWCFVIDYTGDHDIVDLNIPASGHSFMSILVAFLVVARVQITYGRFMEARGYLSQCCQSCRELIQALSVLTGVHTDDIAKQWREDVAVQIVVSLRVTVAAVEFISHGKDPYESVPSDCLPEDLQRVEDFLSRQTHFLRTTTDEALRAPLVFAGTLRKMLLRPRQSKALNVKLLPPEEIKLMSFVTSFCTSVHGLTKLITTPFPFPLVQMSRTLLFFWLFTLPMALMTETAERAQIAVIVFFVTYGFLGLEHVSIEIDDPFGDDPNDFNSLHMAQKVYEDIYLTIYQTDGYQHAEQLRQKVSRKTNINGSNKNA